MTNCGCVAWIYNEEDTSPKEQLHQHSPCRYVSMEELEKLGIIYQKIEHGENDEKLAKLREERNYTSHDVVNITTQFPEEKLTQFFDEHLHEDEEIRLCLEGAGYFDVRDKSQKEWIRIHCSVGDLLIIPAGIYHRFTLDHTGYIKAMRLFTSSPKWIPHSRTESTTDSLPSRIQYLSDIDLCAGVPIFLPDAPQSLANYPHARVLNGLVYLSGFSSRRSDNTHRGVTINDQGEVVDKDVYEQTIGVIMNMKAALEAAGSDLQHLLDITVFLVDMKDYKRFNEAYNLYFNANTGPARTTVAVHQLPHPNLLIEIKGIAAVKRSE